MFKNSDNIAEVSENYLKNSSSLAWETPFLLLQNSYWQTSKEAV
jgi:hypothetical protein